MKMSGKTKSITKSIKTSGALSVSVGIFLLLLLLAGTVRAGNDFDPYHLQGKILAGGTVAFATVSSKQDNSDENLRTTQFSVSASGEYFVLDRLSCGGAAYVAFSKNDSGKGTGLYLVPRANYYFPNDTMFLPYAGVHAGLWTGKNDYDNEDMDSTSYTGLVGGFQCGAKVFFTSRDAIYGELEWSARQVENGNSTEADFVLGYCRFF